MGSKTIHSAPAIGGVTTRREVLRRGAMVAAASIIAPFWSKFVRAQAAPTTFDFYISTTGSDSNPGTLALPWALTALNTKWSTYAGKSVGIIAGTYDCLSLVGGSYYTNAEDYEVAAFEIQGGTSTSQTYVASCDISGNYSPRVAILDAGANMANNPVGKALIGHNGISGQTVGYVTIDGLQVINGFVQLINVGRALAIGSDSMPGITIKNCYVANVSDSLGGTNPACILAQNLNGGLIQNNYLYGASSLGITGQGARASGVQIYWSQNTVVEYNTIIDVDGSCSGGVSFKDTSQRNNTIRYNFVYQPNAIYNGNGSFGGGQCQALGTDEDGGVGSYFNIYNNLAVTQGFTVPSIGGTPATWPPVYTQNWYNNTFVLVAPGSGGFVRLGTARTINFYNNIIQVASGAAGRGPPGLVAINDVSANVWDYNCYPASPSFALSTLGALSSWTALSSLSAWCAALGSRNAASIGQDAHAIAVSDSRFGGSTGIFQGGAVSDPASYRVVAGAPGSATGSYPGSSNGRPTGGSPVDMGCWGGTDVNTGGPITRVGCNFAPGSTSTTADPSAPVLSVS